MDPFQTWRKDLIKRLQAGQDLRVDLGVGAKLIEAAAGRASGADAKRLSDWGRALRKEGNRNPVPRQEVALDEELATLATRYPDRGLSGPQHLFRAWPEIVRQTRSAACIALFADFDGTLTPIRRWPGRVYLGGRVRALLAETSRNGVTVGIISGRRLPDVQKRVGLPGIWYVGAHGYALQEPRGKAVTFISEKALSRMHIVRRKLASELRGMPGIFLEPKEATLAVHYRNAAPATRQAAREVIQQLLELYPQLHLLSGKKVWELLPDRRTSKWTAIRHILKLARRRRSGRRLVFYLGDDSTDERVFEKMKGISVVVGRRRLTAARFFLRSPAEVKEFLVRFCEVVR